MQEREHTITTQDGRTLRVLDTGPEDGLPVLVHHGTPGSRLLEQGWRSDSEARGIRLIGYDRPGYGGSTPHPGRMVGDAAEDAAAIAHALGIDRMATWGASGGGPHALACAALRPDLFSAVASIASLAPYEAEGLHWEEGMGEDNLKENAATREGRAALTDHLRREAADLLQVDAEMLVHALRSLLSPVDAAVVTGDFAASMLADMHAGIGESIEGWVDDDFAFFKPWGFDVRDIRTPTLLLHGQHDLFVPFTHGEWLAARIPDVDARLSTEDGHLTFITRRIPEVHAWLVEHMTV